MQHTFQLNASNLTLGFIYMIKNLFGDKEIRIVVEDIHPADLSRAELYKSTLELIDLFKDAKIDPDINISDIANEVNL
ncbi:hypothetical protein [Dyadobacter jiangsuensis]|uniref:Uncharacterized protein n=1 Tax=Dyadobacter jiangsuensis TaxID=1591085 RepID=A0A2P8FPF5_9BACT|nr:hypothetical protein [Dyadobacter jiangsuensis]PSL23579.1 hypothetical protein CLV60_116135 [Dyadobacter jiangsuensis]